jgi:dTDP-4-dehydrorhamnose reductase
MLGGDLVRAAEVAGHEVTATDSGTLDVADLGAMRRAARDTSPDTIVNCAAYTDVDGAESDVETAMRVNAQGAGNVAAVAAAFGAAVVYISTDYVFDGSKETPYVESDEPNPLGRYGASKLAGEVETAAANARHHIVRTSWLFGTRGRNFVETMLGLATKLEEVSVVDDQTGSPTYTSHLADGIVRLLDSDAYGVRHMAAEGQCTWYDFAVAIFRNAGISCTTHRTSTEAMGRPAPRPRYSVLGTERADAIGLPPWQAGLDAYLEAR